MAKIIGIALITVFLAACGSPPNVSDQQSADQSMGLLFESHGVAVYRFYDKGHYHYVAVPGDGRYAATATNYSYLVNCGKNCHRRVYVNDEVQTLWRR